MSDRVVRKSRCLFLRDDVFIKQKETSCVWRWMVSLSVLDYFLYLTDISLHVFVRHLVVLERAGEVLVVGCHVDEAVA